MGKGWLNLKQLSAFNQFDLGEFLVGKVLMVAAITPIKVYKDGEPVGEDGSKIETIITVDKTKYPNPDPNMTNSFERFNVKVPEDIKTVRGKLKIGNKYNMKKYIKASVYGDYRNQLSVSSKLDYIEVIDKWYIAIIRGILGLHCVYSQCVG